MRVIRVVIGDDDPAFREAVRDVLTADPRFHVVAAVASGDELCRVAADEHPDVALVDIRMPGGGPEAVRALVADALDSPGHVDHPRKSLTVVAVSAHTGVHDVRTMLQAGATGYLAKGRIHAALPDLVHRCAYGEVVLAVPTGARALQLLVEPSGHKLSTRRRHRPVTYPDVPYPDVIFQVLDASASPVLGVSPSGAINYANAQALCAFGYDADELIGQPVEILVPSALATRHVQLRETYVLDPAPRAMGSDLDLSARRKDGSTFPVEISLTPLPTDDGPWVLTGFVDISARRAAEERVRALSRAHLALAELNIAILRAQTPDELFVEACRVVGAGGGDYLSVWIGRRSGTGGVEVVASAGDVGPIGGDADILADLPAIAGVLDTSARWFCGDVGAESSGRWRAWAQATGIVTAVSLPLVRDSRPVAAITVQSTRRALLDDEYLSILMTMADNLSFALDRFAAQAQLQRVNAQRVDLLSRLVAAQEEERARIAGDIHDHSIQSLAALDLRLGLLRSRLDATAPGLTGSVDEVHAGLAQVMVDLRHLLFDLEVADPGVSLIEQLHDALDHVFVDLPVRTVLRVTGSAPEAPVDLPHDLRIQAVRICKEALTNVRRHAQAQTVTIEVHAAAEGMEIAVVDDGVGPPTDASTLRSAHGHHGVDGMRGRAEASGGWFRIVRVGGLTTVRFWLPYGVASVVPS